MFLKSKFYEYSLNIIATSENRSVNYKLQNELKVFKKYIIFLVMFELINFKMFYFFLLFYYRTFNLVNAFMIIQYVFFLL